MNIDPDEASYNSEMILRDHSFNFHRTWKLLKSSSTEHLSYTNTIFSKKNTKSEFFTQPKAVFATVIFETVERKILIWAYIHAIYVPKMFVIVNSNGFLDNLPKRVGFPYNTKTKSFRDMPSIFGEKKIKNSNNFRRNTGVSSLWYFASLWVNKIFDSKIVTTYMIHLNFRIQPIVSPNSVRTVLGFLLTAVN